MGVQVCQPAWQAHPGCHLVSLRTALIQDGNPEQKTGWNLMPSKFKVLGEGGCLLACDVP